MLSPRTFAQGFNKINRLAAGSSTFIQQQSSAKVPNPVRPVFKVPSKCAVASPRAISSSSIRYSSRDQGNTLPSSSSFPSPSASSPSSTQSPTLPQPPTFPPLEPNPQPAHFTPEVKDDRFTAAASEELLQQPATSPQPIGKIESRLSITFTCTVPGCGHRSSHEFSRHSYEKGIVLVQCPGCESRHLIG